MPIFAAGDDFSNFLQSNVELKTLTDEVLKVRDLQKLKKHMMECVEQKDLEIGESTSKIESSLHKIVGLVARMKAREAEILETHNAELTDKIDSFNLLREKHAEVEEDLSSKLADVELKFSECSSSLIWNKERVRELEAKITSLEEELWSSEDAAAAAATANEVHLRAQLSTEKETLERHNVELTAQIDSFNLLREKHADVEQDLSSKLADVEIKFSECSSSLKWNKERVRELEATITSLEEELWSSEDAAAATATANEVHLHAQLLTLMEHVELYKKSEEKWSKMAKELETRLTQAESDYKEKLGREEYARKQSEKEAADLKSKFDSLHEEMKTQASGSLERLPNGWTMFQTYSKYQEASDELRGEKLRRKESEANLQRVVAEVEKKSAVILDERVEHERLVESYALVYRNLQQSISEQADMEKTIKDLKSKLEVAELDKITRSGARY